MQAALFTTINGYADTTIKGIESQWKYVVQNARRKHLNEMGLPVTGNKTTAAWNAAVSFQLSLYNSM